MGETIVVIIHIYESRAISLLFYNHQDTNSKAQESGVGVARPILTQKTTSKAICDNNIYTPQDGSKTFWQLFICMELQPISVYFMITKKLNLSNVD